MNGPTPPDGSPHRLRRLPQRGSYDRAVIHAILDEGLFCSVGIATADGPVVIPMAYARLGDEVVLHGAPASRLLQAAGGGTPVCVTVTLLDGLVLARSAFHHSLNYRSAVLFGVARELTDAGEKAAALRAVVEHLLPGRSAAARPPTPKELAATRVLAMRVDAASAKRRSGGPLDDAADQDWPCWAGEVPLALVAQAPRPTTEGSPPGPPPPAIAGYDPGRRRPIG
ncbi:MAG TPA: pyridoxamine 5'-phosphate oxidase family protein [Polyangia bacterium]|nr:pyridoxamine 5'-phosphate oxidase family protein [Polyangia bacterium]